MTETVKLNFHLELHATLVSNLNSRLFLELEVLCALVSYISLDWYKALMAATLYLKCHSLGLQA
jgi:hypothetical protein